MIENDPFVKAGCLPRTSAAHKAALKEIRGVVLDVAIDLMWIVFGAVIVIAGVSNMIGDSEKRDAAD